MDMYHNTQFFLIVLNFSTYLLVFWQVFAMFGLNVSLFPWSEQFPWLELSLKQPLLLCSGSSQCLIYLTYPHVIP